MAARTLIQLSAACGLAMAVANPAAGVPPRDWRVYFGLNNDRVSPADAATVGAFASYAREVQPAMVLVVGHADRSGEADYNRDLSLRRALNVAEALGEQGLDGRIVTIEGRGESEPAVATEDDVVEALNRRAEIVWLK